MTYNFFRPAVGQKSSLRHASVTVKIPAFVMPPSRAKIRVTEVTEAKKKKLNFTYMGPTLRGRENTKMQKLQKMQKVQTRNMQKVQPWKYKKCKRTHLKK